MRRRSDRCAIGGDHGCTIQRCACDDCVTVDRVTVDCVTVDQRVTERFGNAVLLTHDGYGHVSDKDHSTCIEEWRVKYLVDLEAPPAGTVCAADQKPFSD